MSAPTVAAIDCGTNSTRLLVATMDDAGRLHQLDRLMTITRLGEGVDASGLLADSAIDRVLACLLGYREVLDGYDIASIRMTATSAARDAANRATFFDAAEAVVGARPELLSGSEEGRLSFLGATSDLDPTTGPFLVVDIGGGSTEFAYGGDSCQGAISTDMGCVRITEQFIHSEPPLPEELASALSVVGLHLDDVLAALPEAPTAARLVGLAGTVSTTAMVEQGLVDYDRDRVHHFELTKAAVEDVFRTLATEDRDERLANPGMEPGRVDVIVGGLCVLVGIMRRFEFESCLASEADILDGLAISQLA